jgi:hypothetical protein
MPIPAAVDADVRRFLDDAFGEYFDFVTSDGTQFIALLSDFDVGKKDLKLFHLINLQFRIVPLGRDQNCPMEVFGFASNTTNANFSHEQNRELALDRMAETVKTLEVNGVPGPLVTLNFADSGEIGDPGVEDPEERFAMVIVTLNGATPPPPLALST